MSHFRSKQLPDFLFIPLCSAFALLLISAGAILWIKPESIRNNVVEILSILINLYASLSLLTASIRTFRVSRRLGIAWGFFFLAQLLYTMGDLVWAVLYISAKKSMFPSLADAFYTAYYPLMLIGILLLPQVRSSLVDSLKITLSYGIVIIASILVFYNLFIGRYIVLQLSFFDLTTLLSIGYFTGGLVLSWGLLVLINRHHDFQNKVPLALLGVGITLMIITDTIYLVQLLSGTYVIGELLNLGWFTNFLLAAIAGSYQAHSCTSEKLPVPREGSNRLLSRVVAIIPYFWVISALGILILAHYKPLPMNYKWIALGVELITLLMIFRQCIALVENRRLILRLNQALELVQSQASDMELINADLSGQIQERRKAEELLAYQAYYDSLTGLPNRNCLISRLKQIIENARVSPEHSFSVLFLDLDHFKTINDSLGHTTGDKLLVEVSQRLTQCIRPQDTIARIGGDEFIILLEDTKGDAPAIEVAVRIMEALKDPFCYRDHEVFTTSSIGILTQQDGNSVPEEIFKNVDIAMYRAKSLGKSQFALFTEELSSQVVLRLQLENELHLALENNEIQIFYQPIYSLPCNRIVGFEALARWIHPTKGIIPSNEFIPIAEETGLVEKIDEWMLKKACQQIQNWNQVLVDQKFFINVNISNRQFAKTDFAERIRQILQDTHLDPEYLNLEITERVVMENLYLANSTISSLQESGVNIQIDDFGTGYCSLSYLQHFPIRGIKIDRSFISEIDQPGKNMVLVKTILRMAKDLGIEAIAEGVETKEQLEILRKLSCEYAQGFYLSKPMETVSVEEMLREKKEMLTLDASISVER